MVSTEPVAPSLRSADLPRSPSVGPSPSSPSPFGSPSAPPALLGTHLSAPSIGAGPSASTAAPADVHQTAAGFAPLAAGPSGLRAPALPASTSSSRDTAPGVAPAPIGLPAGDDARALAHAISPGPAAQRREAAPPDAELSSQSRRRSDAARPIPSVVPGGRSSPPTNPPPLTGAPSRPAPTTNPPPLAPSVPAPPSLGSSSPPASPAPPSLPPPGPGAPIVPSTAGFAPNADPPWATGYPRAPAGFNRDFDTPPSAVAIVPTSDREPPPTRIHRPEALVDRPFTPPKVSQVPSIPEPGLVNSARYAIRFAKARWQRRGAIKLLGADIKKDTDALDQVLGALGGVARTAKLDGRVFSGENAAITGAEDRAAQMTREHNDVDNRKLEENSKFVEVERERNTKLGEAERQVDEAQKELAQLEAQRRGLRDTRKELERRQKAYLKAAEDAEKQAGNTELGDQRQDLRRSAEQHRREAAALEPERQELDRRLAAIERPISEATARLDAAKAELDAAKRSLADAREGHTHRLAELDAEQKRKAREIAQAEAEIARRLVTLGTLVNLNRIDDPQFDELYQRIDRLRGAITARTTEIEKLTAEREAYDRGNLVRGVATIGGAIVLFIALIVILRALLLR